MTTPSKQLCDGCPSPRKADEIQKIRQPSPFTYFATCKILWFMYQPFLGRNHMKQSMIFLTLLVSGLSYGSTGSTFREVLKVLENKDFVPQSEIEKKEFAVYASGKLPQYKMNYMSVFGKGKHLKEDAQRTINDHSDYFPRIEKLLHPNGVCVVGSWQMTEANPYSGLFKNGSKALFVGRVSVAMEKTSSKSDRGFGFAGKLFPTNSPDERVNTINFFSVDILMGENTPHFLGTAVTNEPESGFKLRLIALGLKITKALKLADKNPMFRPVTPIAKVGEKTGNIKSPKWMRMSAEDGTILNDEKDFRNEVVKALADNKILKLKVEVSETTKDRHATTGWNKVGVIKIDRAMVSYGCDRRLHFNHPKSDD